MQSLTITKSVINSQAVSELLVLNATIKKKPLFTVQLIAQFSFKTSGHLIKV